MMLSDVAVVGRPLGVGHIFDPARLFAAGQSGVWLDPSDQATLFQDAAGTVAVSGPDQPVGRILDKSGNGRHATQSVSAARPTWRKDSAGRGYLDFDGVDDWMTCGTVDPAGATRASLCVGLRKISDATTGMVLSMGAWGGHSLDLRAPGSFGGANLGGYARAPAGGTQIGALAPGFAAPVSAVATALVDLTASQGAEFTMRVNGITTAQNTGTSFDSTGSLPGGTLWLGRRQDAAVLLLRARVYGVLIRFAPWTTIERQRIEFFMANRTGVMF